MSDFEPNFISNKEKSPPLCTIKVSNYQPESAEEFYQIRQLRRFDDSSLGMTA